MNASKTLTASVIVATVVGALGFVSAQIDEREVAEAATGWWSQRVGAQAQPAAYTAPAALSKLPPMAIDPRRMQAPAEDQSSNAASADEARIGTDRRS